MQSPNWGRRSAGAGRRHQLFETERRGTIEAKGKGRLDSYFLNRLKPEFSADGASLVFKSAPG